MSEEYAHLPGIIALEKTSNLITRIYNGKASDLIASLVNSDGLTQDDLAELREMFKVEE